MLTEKQIVQAALWKQQTVAEARAWAAQTTKDKKQLAAFEAGVARGWRECQACLAMHNWITDKGNV